LYDCSSQELNKLINICRKNGAIGSRLTGAGWGGCSISLIWEKDEKEFMKNVTLEYYDELKELYTDINEVLFSSAPCNGALIYKNTEFLC